MTAQILQMFPDEYRFTSRRIVAANNSYGIQFAPEAPMAVDVPCIEYAPNVNTTRQPPALAAYRKSRMNNMPAAVEAFSAALALVALVALAMVPDRVAENQTHISEGN